MDDNWHFSYSVRQPPAGGLVEMNKDELERHLLKRLELEKDHVEDALGDLACFYADFGQFDQALGCIRQLMERRPTLEGKAGCILAMGATMEKARNYEAAVRFYKEAFAMEPMSTEVWYWINNNLGFSLNTLGRFEEGVVYCQNAVQIDTHRPNGYKNLGLAYQGLGQYREAAACFVAATRANATDGRSLKHLEELLSKHPELACELAADLEHCRQAVKVAAEANSRLQPVIHRGWRRAWFLFKMRLRMSLKSLIHRWC